ncbi:MAG: response regulator receiver protein [Methylococcales bacterium]|nr:response regulator receiver protein [Methylococcales bacterium]
MFFKEWVVLLVDDEPDVLSVSKLAMRSIKVYDLPLKIVTAASKAAAIELFQSNLELSGSLAVAFIDVVMETDSAGLELCQFIREEMENKVSQLFIRTGQPGMSPEREVIDRYDISGYFSKVETTEDKLYSLVKSSVRQFLSIGMALATINILNEMLVNSHASRADLLETIHHIAVGGEGESTWLIVENQVLFADEVNAKGGIAINTADGGLALYKKLAKSEGFPLDFSGDKYVRSEGNFHLIHVTEKYNQVEVGYLFKTKFNPPEHIIALVYSFVQGLASIWNNTSIK